MDKQEHAHRLAFAERQFELYKLRATQAQLEASYRMALGDHAGANEKLGAARNFLQFLNECNETIDDHRRAIAFVKME